MLRTVLRLSPALLCIVVAVPPRVASAVEAAPEPAAGSEAWRDRLAELVESALSSNPELRAKELEVEAARHRVPQAMALPAPELELALEDVPVHSPSLTRDEFTMETVTLRQALPARGERRARRAVAAADVDEVSAVHRGHVVDVASATADSFFALAGIDRKLAILGDARLRLESVAAAATERFRVGQAGQADVLRASLESTQLDEAILVLRAERGARVAGLAALLGQPASELAQVEAQLPDDIDQRLPVPPVEELERLAAERSPELVAARSKVTIASGELELARLEGKPDWMLASYYGRRERFDDFLGVSAAVSLPWARRHRLAESRAEKESSHAATQAAAEAVRWRLRGEIGEAYAELEKLRQQLRLYRDVVLPQAEIHFASAREGYAGGRVDFLTFASAASELEQYRLETADRIAGIGRAVAALQRASGVALLPGMPLSGDDHEAQ